MKNENKNLKENLLLNKEIIDNFYLENNKYKEKFYYEKIKQENINLTNQYDKILEENKQYRNQVNFISLIKYTTYYFVCTLGACLFRLRR